MEEGKFVTAAQAEGGAAERKVATIGGEAA
jgi:hypothetical protein